MVKLKLIANPTFDFKVGIPVAGGDPVMVEMKFKHRTKTGLDEFIKGRTDKTDTETFMEMVVGWDLEDPFTRESVDMLLENYAGASLAAFRVYIDQLVQTKVKN